MVKRLSTTDQNSNALQNVPDPTSAQDAATKIYVDKARVESATVGLTSGDYPVSGYANFTAALNAAFAASNNVKLRNGTYILTTAYALASGKTLEGESKRGVILQQTAATNATVLTNADASTGITTNVTIKNLTIDQQGTLQTTGGGGIIVTGIQGWHIENVIIKKSYKFNFLALHQGNGLTNKTGTFTFTKDSEILTGTGTLFLTELSKDDIVKSAGAQFCRVASIISNTQVILTTPWGYTTETGVTAKVTQPNSGNYIKNVRFEGTVNDADASGYGFFDNSIIEDCEAFGAAGGGCGFVPDHSRGVRLINCRAHDNNNSGFSYETGEDIVTIGCRAWNNVNGYQLISGSVRCLAIGVESYNNSSHGLTTANNISTAGVPSGNSFDSCNAYNNGGAGFRVDGCHNTRISNSRGFNNTTAGLIINVANSIIPSGTKILNSSFYDDRTTKVQAYGIQIASATNTSIIGTTSLASDNLTNGILDSGTNTAVLTSDNGGVGINNLTPANKLNVNVPNTALTGRDVVITSGAAANIPFAIEAAPSQSGNLFELISSAGNPYLYITSGGIVRTTTSAVTAPAYAFTAEGGTGMGRVTGLANTLFLSTAATMRVQIDTNKTQFTHGMQYSRTIVGGVNYSVAANDYIIEYTTLPATKTVTLPTAVGATGQVYIIKDGAGLAGTNNLVLATTSAQTIDGAATLTIAVNYGAVAIYSDGANWKVLYGNYATVGGSGTVTTVSVVSANGFAGTVATPTLTPAITISTSITGLLKGNGTALSAASAGTDYLAPAGSGAALTGITESQVTGLVADLAAKATDSLVVHLAGIETISGAKTFSGLTADNVTVSTAGTTTGFRSTMVGTGINAIFDSNNTSSAGVLVRNSTALRTGTGAASLFVVQNSNVSATGDTMTITNAAPTTSKSLVVDSTALVVKNGQVGIGKVPTTVLDVSGNVTATTFTGSGASLTAIPESAVTNLTTDLGLKAPIASPTFTGTVGGITAVMVGAPASTTVAKISQGTSAPATPTTGDMWVDTN